MHMPFERRMVAALLITTLAGCGGVARDIAEDTVSEPLDALLCGLQNCTESSTLRVDEISPRFSATQTDGEQAVVIEGSLGKSANLFTTVLMAPNESLSASVDGGPEVALADPDGKRWRYTARLAATSAQPVVRIVFMRDGVRHVSEVTMPARFTVLQPTGAPALARGSADLAVRLSLATSNDALDAASGNCSRTDGSSFDVKKTDLRAVPQTSVAGGYRLQGAAVDEALNDASRSANSGAVTTPLVSRCQLTVAWQRKVWGTSAATLNSHTSVSAIRQATHPLSYDGQR